MQYALLVCDDEEDARHLDQAFRAQSGNVSVNCMNGGLKLLDFIVNHPLDSFPFLIIIDQYLPDMDSLLVLTKLKAHQYGKVIPVAIMSGFASEKLIREYYVAGANCFYRKPLDQSEWSHMADCLLTLFSNRMS
jgi:chemotaxis family two-component system response regulator Rcp1